MDIPQALYLMREGRILRSFTQLLDQDFPAQEFFVSRYVALKASIFRGRPEELAQFLTRPSPSPARKLLEPLAIDPEELDISPEAFVDSSLATELAVKIHKKPNLRTCAIEASRRERRALLNHFFNLVPDPPTELALIDLGYTGTIQRCLQQIFKHENVLTKTHGLYLVTNHNIRKLQETGASAEGYLVDQDQPDIDFSFFYAVSRGC